MVQHLRDPGHDVVGAGQGDGISQGPVAVHGTDGFSIRPVLCPPLREPHHPLTFPLCGKTDAAAQGIVLIPKGKGGHITG